MSTITKAQKDGADAAESAYTAGICFFCHIPISPIRGKDGKPLMRNGRVLLGINGLCRPCAESHYD